MAKSATSLPLQSAEQKREATLRGWINWLKIWSVCDNTACERAHCCRAWASGCFKRNFPRLPQGVQDGFAALIIAREDGLSFDEAWAEMTDLGLVDELANWQALVRGGEASGAVN
jgi:hypothetical protein